MSKGLEYFKNIYDVVPGWIQKMHDHNPSMLDYYTNIRGEAFADSALSAKEKDALVASMNAGRLYERSMMYHTKGAIDKGLEVVELVEYFLISYLYRGLEAFKLAMKAIEYAFELKGFKVNPATYEIENIEQAFNILSEWLINEDDNDFSKTLKAMSLELNDESVNNFMLKDTKISSKFKHLAMVGCYIAELNGEGAGPWVGKAREVGVSEVELADIGYISILTAGIPSWFELSDLLK